MWEGIFIFGVALAWVLYFLEIENDIVFQFEYCVILLWEEFQFFGRRKNSSLLCQKA